MWHAAAHRWTCSDEIEDLISQGVGNGCPSGEHVGASTVTWVRLGQTVEYLRVIGAAAAEPTLYGSQVAPGNNRKAAIMVMVDKLQSSVVSLEESRYDLVNTDWRDGVGVLQINFPRFLTS